MIPFYKPEVCERGNEAGSLAELGYKDAAKIPVRQFIEYLKKSPSLENFKYVFNGKKRTDAQIREGLKVFYTNHAQTIFEALDEDLFEQLFEVTDVPSFLSNLNNTNPYWRNHYTRFISRK